MHPVAKHDQCVTADKLPYILQHRLCHLATSLCNKLRRRVQQGEGLAHTSGLSWFGVLVIARLPSDLLTTQAQPLPKRPAAAALNLLLSSSREPKAESMAPFRSPEGPFVLDGFVKTCQKKLWFRWPPPLFLQVNQRSTSSREKWLPISAAVLRVQSDMDPGPIVKAMVAIVLRPRLSLQADRRALEEFF